MAFECIFDETKKILTKNRVLAIVTNTGMVMAGEVIGMIKANEVTGVMPYEEKVVIKYPALIQSRPQIKDGKQSIQMFFTLLLPDSACSYTSRYVALADSSILTMEALDDEMLKAYVEFCTKVHAGIFSKTMTEQEMEKQDEYYYNLIKRGMLPPLKEEKQESSK